MLYKNFFCSCCEAPKRPLWHLWLTAPHHITPKGALSLSETTAVTDLESPMPNPDYRATWRTEEMEKHIKIAEWRRERAGRRVLRQVGTWRNVLSGSCSAMFVSLCNVCQEEKDPGNESSDCSTWWCPNAKQTLPCSWSLQMLSLQEHSDTRQYLNYLKTTLHYRRRGWACRPICRSQC